MPKEFGEVGSKIPGSLFLRDYCSGCNEPIRVTAAGIKNFCRDCNGEKPPPFMTGLTPRQRHKLGEVSS